MPIVSRWQLKHPNGPVIDALLAAGLTIVVISPNQVKNLRGRYGSGGNKVDRFDALLADTLRTDLARLRTLVPESDATTALRHTVCGRRDLVATASQLRAHLRSVLPAAVDLFADVYSPISLAFLTRFDTQDRADGETPKRLGDWLSKQGYSGKIDPAVLRVRIVAAPRGATGSHGAAHVPVTAAFVADMNCLLTQIKVVAGVEIQLTPHSDAHVFTSLPLAGRVRAARLLAEIGDCRVKFPTPKSLTWLAGVAASTRQSGKIRAVGLRWALAEQLRDAICDFAGDSRRAKPWADQLYRRTRGRDHPHTVRTLARPWLDISWRCWRDNSAYDPQCHGALEPVIQQPTSGSLTHDFSCTHLYGETAIDDDLLAGDVAGGMRGEESDDVGHLLWPAHPAERDVFPRSFQALRP